VSEIAANASPKSKGRLYAPWVLFVLACVSLVNYYDRNLISILVEPIKHDLHISDTEIGLLTGLAFAVVYSFVGVPVARLADRFGRTRVLTSAITLWSAMTIATGMTSSFATMALARLGVGAGEAGGLPTTHALASEYFSANRRGTALGVIAFFAAAGVSLALVAGGQISDRFGWRTAFYVGGAAGLAIALLMLFTIRDAPRDVDPEAPATSQTPSFGSAIRTLWGRRAYAHLCLGLAWGAFGSYALLTWTPAFFMRAYHMTAGQVGTSYGSVFALSSLGAVLVGGLMADMLKRWDERSPFWLLILAFGLGVPGGLMTFLVHDYKLVLLVSLPLNVVQALWVAPAYALVQNLSGSPLRATGAALFMMIVNIIGLGFGPSAVGLISDLLKPYVGSFSLGLSLIIATLTFVPAVIHFMLATRTVRKDIEAAAAT
jgi:MFS family permease